MILLLHEDLVNLFRHRVFSKRFTLPDAIAVIADGLVLVIEIIPEHVFRIFRCAYGARKVRVSAATAPLLTGRSVAVGGNCCATPVNTCLLSHTSWVGNGCSCTVYGGHARGTV